jgi:hypothetical protein
VEPTGARLEALFRPSTRYRDSHPKRRGGLPQGWTEIELLQDLAPEDVLATGITWEDFCLFLLNKVVWMTPDVCVSGYRNTYDPEVLALRAEAYTPIMRVHVRLFTAAAAATATCDFLLRLVATREIDGVCIYGDRNVPPPLSGAGLSLFFQESRSCLRQARLYSMILNGEQWRALATMSRLDVELVIKNCKLADNVAGRAFVNCL